MYLIFVDLWLCVFGCVLQRPIRYYELMLGRNEILASKHDIAKGQTRALGPPSWFFAIFSSFITAAGV